MHVCMYVFLMHCMGRLGSAQPLNARVGVIDHRHIAHMAEKIKSNLPLELIQPALAAIKIISTNAPYRTARKS